MCVALQTLLLSQLERKERKFSRTGRAAPDRAGARPYQSQTSFTGVSRLLMTQPIFKDRQSSSVLGLGSSNRLGDRIAAGHAEQCRNFTVTQTGMIPAQRNGAATGQVVAFAAFFERLSIGLKVLTHPFQNLLRANRCRPTPFP